MKTHMDKPSILIVNNHKGKESGTFVAQQSYYLPAGQSLDNLKSP